MISYHDEEYLDLIEYVLDYGVEKTDRTGTGTLSVFGSQMRFDLSDGTIPLLTTKKIHTKSIIHEILWYLQGNTNVRYLQENGVRIWNEWADENGDLGPIYGHQWRKWTHTKVIGSEWDVVKHNGNTTTIFNTKVQQKTHDQIADAINRLKTNPTDRRIIINAWNVGELEEMSLPPCHAFFQFWSDGHRLSCQLYQRSCDIGLGVPFNIVQYSILLRMIAQVTNLTPGEFIWTGGDVHIYNNHVEPLKEQLNRSPYPSPTLKLNPELNNIDDFRFDDFVIENYKCHPTIKMEVSV